jgi:RecB family exonuclease
MELVYSRNSKNAVEDSIEKAFEEIFFKTAKSRDEYSGEEMIFFKVVSRMAQNALSYDEKYAPFEILGLEEEFYFEKGGIKIGGIIDRIDKKDGTVRVVDYKTGKIPEKNDFESEISNIFSSRRAKKANYQFQTYLYSSILAQDERFRDFTISSNLIFTLSADNGIYTFADDFSRIKKEFDEELEKKSAELFDSRVPFSQREDDGRCRFCDYSEICGRE